MSDMREYAAQHGWEVGSHLRYAGCVGPSSVITSIEAHEVRISTPGDFPGRLTRSTRLEKWTLDWQYRAEKAEATIARVRDDIERRLALSNNPDFGHLVPVETLRGILRRFALVDGETPY